MIVRNCWITGNTTTNYGGAIWVAAGTQNPEIPTAFTVLNSTISGNGAGRNGGGIAVGGGRLSVVNSTVTGNSAGDQGGGAFVSGGNLFITNSTLAINRADSDGLNDPGTDLGGGIARLGGNVTLKNSIVLGNVRGTGTAVNEIEGAMIATSMRNIIGHVGVAGGLLHGTNSNIVGNNGAGILPLSSVMQSTPTISAGKTPTHNLVAASLAIDSGANSLTDGDGGVSNVRTVTVTPRFVRG